MIAHTGTSPLPSSPRIGAIAIAIGVIGCADQPLSATGDLSVETFDSAVVDDEYKLRIRVPPGYDETGNYPLIVQLDPTYVGLQQYDITVGFVSQGAADDDWDEAIVVGVDYDDPSLRERDYALPDPPDPDYGGDGADLFYRMLADELVPYLEGEYAIDPTRRYIVGHSNGGIFAWYAVFRHDPTAGPPLFTGAVAADNGYVEELFTYERWHHERADDLPVTIRATRAAFNGGIQKVGFEAMIDRVRDRDFASLVLETEVLETDHAGAVWPSYEDGLELLLGGGR